MKRILTALITLLSLPVTAQQYKAIDFFFPTGNINKSLLVDPDGAGFTSNIWYFRDGDTVSTVNFQYVNNAQAARFITEYWVVEREVKIIYERRSSFAENEKVSLFAKHNVFLKVPSTERDSVDWTYVDRNRQKIKCLARLTTEVVGTDTLEAVNVRKTVLKGKKETKNTWEEKYVRGIGYFARENRGRPVEILEGQEYDPQAGNVQTLVIVNRPYPFEK